MRYFINILFIHILFTSSVVVGKDFKDYLNYTNKAEVHIIHNDFKNAEKCFDTAFQIWNKPFASDLFNDMKCANIDKNYVLVKNIASRLIMLGCELSFFERPVYLAEFRASQQWVYLRRDYLTIRKKYLDKNNAKLRDSIQMMQKKDQFLRQLDQNYTFLKDSIYKVDDTVKQYLLNVFKYKFPNEYDYGVFLSDDTTLLRYEPLHYIILHNYAKFDLTDLPNANTHTYDFTKIFINAIKCGEMHPQEFAYLNDRSGKFKLGIGYGQEGILTKIKGELYFENVPPESIYKYNEDRFALGLDSYSQEKEKALYGAQDKNSFILFRYLGYVTFWHGFEFTEKQIKNLFLDTGVKIQ